MISLQNVSQNTTYLNGKLLNENNTKLEKEDEISYQDAKLNVDIKLKIIKFIQR